MTRLIDADVFEKHLEDEWILHEISNKGLEQIGKWLAQEKTVDAVPVIRCKDCKWFVHDDDCYGDCSNEGGAKDFVYTNDFCSRAEKKENAEKNDSNSVNNNDHSVCDN